VKLKLEYWDSDGDICIQEFNSIQELNSFANMLPDGYVIGILTPEDEIERKEEILLQTMYFPPNKVN